MKPYNPLQADTNVIARLIDGTGAAISTSNPLPFASPGASAATSTPLTGSATSTSVLGPFTPQLGRAIWVTLSGTWAGTVTVKRSTDGGTTKLPLTVGGSAWGVFTANCNEPVAEESDASATYYLDFAFTSGTLVYRVSQ